MDHHLVLLLPLVGHQVLLLDHQLGQRVRRKLLLYLLGLYSHLLLLQLPQHLLLLVLLLLLEIHLALEVLLQSHLVLPVHLLEVLLVLPVHLLEVLLGHPLILVLGHLLCHQDLVLVLGQMLGQRLCLPLGLGRMLRLLLDCFQSQLLQEILVHLLVQMLHLLVSQMRHLWNLVHQIILRLVL